MSSALRAMLAVGGFAIASTAPAVAQDDGPSRNAISVGVGAMQFDLSGTGTAPMGVLRYDRTLGHWWVADLGVAYARPEQQFGATTNFIVPEAQIQFQLPIKQVAPYLGVGIGRAIDIRDAQFGGTVARETYSVAAGLRAWATERVGAGAELRVRGIGRYFSASAAEWTIGAMWRF